MRTIQKSKRAAEFGDFQTPRALAHQACRLLTQLEIRPASIVEPTCGTGNFLAAALDEFGNATEAIGLDINPEYISAATSRLRGRGALLVCDSFFETDWPKLLGRLPEPILVIGNPPWVTNAQLSALGSSNLPKKSNFQRLTGFQAITGKANFDISEWMLILMLEWLEGRNATMAMLCKTTVARKVLTHAWKNQIHLNTSRIYGVDAAQHFGASVGACFLVCDTLPPGRECNCPVYKDMAAKKAAQAIGFRDGVPVADITLYHRWKHLQGEQVYKWRSGIKHDCSKVMELRSEGGRYRNRLGKVIELEDDYLFPMLKSSDLGAAIGKRPRRWMLVTQRAVGDETDIIRSRAPATWKYLEQHAPFLDRRGSSVYKDRPRFSVFGVGPYTFAPWKVAISGFYKKLEFTVVGRFEGKPTVLDDTAYFIPCDTKGEAVYLASLFNSPIATEFFRAWVFWDTKRPITAELLRRLDLLALARELGTESRMLDYLSRKGKSHSRRCTGGRDVQGRLFSNGSSTRLLRTMGANDTA